MRLQGCITKVKPCESKKLGMAPDGTCSDFGMGAKAVRSGRSRALGLHACSCMAHQSTSGLAHVNIGNWAKPAVTDRAHHTLTSCPRAQCLLVSTARRQAIPAHERACRLRHYTPPPIHLHPTPLKLLGGHKLVKFATSPPSCTSRNFPGNGAFQGRATADAPG